MEGIGNLSHRDWFCAACPLLFRLGIPQRHLATVKCPLCGLETDPAYFWSTTKLVEGMAPFEGQNAPELEKLDELHNRWGFGRGPGQGSPAGLGSAQRKPRKRQ